MSFSDFLEDIQRKAAALEKVKDLCEAYHECLPYLSDIQALFSEWQSLESTVLAEDHILAPPVSLPDDERYEVPDNDQTESAVESQQRRALMKDEIPCEYCDYIAKNETGLSIHVRKKHQEIVPPEKPRIDLVSNSATHISEPKTSECPHCHEMKDNRGFTFHVKSCAQRNRHDNDDEQAPLAHLQCEQLPSDSKKEEHYNNTTTLQEAEASAVVQLIGKTFKSEPFSVYDVLTKIDAKNDASPLGPERILKTMKELAVRGYLDKIVPHNPTENIRYKIATG